MALESEMHLLDNIFYNHHFLSRIIVFSQGVLCVVAAIITCLPIISLRDQKDVPGGEGTVL